MKGMRTGTNSDRNMHLKTIEYIRNVVDIFHRAAAFKLGFPVRPYEVMWSITWRCNLACNYCRTGKADTAEAQAGELSFEEAKKVIVRLREGGVKSVILLGGEPLLYKDIFNVISCCKENGIIVRLVTNGTLITEDVARKLAATGIDHISISLDSPDTVQDELRNCKGCFERIDAAIRHLVAYRDRGGYDLHLSCILTNKNSESLEALFAYADKTSIHDVTLQPLNFHLVRNRETAERYRIEAHDLPDLSRRVQRLLRRYAHLNRHPPLFTDHIVLHCLTNRIKDAQCFAGGPVISMYPDGTIIPCMNIQAEKCGTLRTASLAKITRSEPFRSLVRRIKKGECTGCCYTGVHYFDLFFKPIEMLRYLITLRSAGRPAAAAVKRKGACAAVWAAVGRIWSRKIRGAG